MILGIAEDFSSNIKFDRELTEIPSSGLFLNSGVHPSITVENLLAFLPLLDLDFEAYSDVKTYGKFTESRNKSDIVTYNGKIYQSLNKTNLNHQPDISANDWIETTIESLRVKNLIEKVKDRVYSELNLTKKLVNNQYLYEVGQNAVTLPNDYAAWIFEAKGSDYVKFRINQISIQKSGTTPVDLYVVNNGILVDTLSITPDNGNVSFRDLDYEFSGAGQWRFIIDSTDVYTNNVFIDPLKYDGFMVYTANGTGASPETSSFNYGATGNGLGFNVTVFSDAKVYIDNNLPELGNFVRAAFEMVTLEMFVANSSNRSNRAKWIQDNSQMLQFETKDMQNNTVARRYDKEKTKALNAIKKTFDTHLFEDDGLQVEVTSV